MDESTMRTEVEITGTISFDPTTGLLSLDIETAQSEKPFGCLSWAFTTEDEEFQQMMEVLQPLPID